MTVRKSTQSKFSVDIDPELHHSFKQAVIARKTTIKRVITGAVSDYLGRPPTPAPAADQNVIAFRDDPERALIEAALDCWRKQPRRRSDLLEALDLFRLAKTRDHALVQLGFALVAWKTQRAQQEIRKELPGA